MTAKPLVPQSPRMSRTPAPEQWFPDAFSAAPSVAPDPGPERHVWSAPNTQVHLPTGPQHALFLKAMAPPLPRGQGSWPLVISVASEAVSKLAAGWLPDRVNTDTTFQDHHSLFTSNATLCFQAWQTQLLLPPTSVLAHPPVLIPSSFTPQGSLLRGRALPPLLPQESAPTLARPGPCPRGLGLGVRSLRGFLGHVHVAHRRVFPPHTPLGHDSKRGPLLAETQPSKCAS